MKQQRILPTILGILLLAIAVPMALTSRGSDTPVPERSRIHRVEVEPVRTSSTPRSLRFPGTVRSETRARLSFQISGRVAARPVDIGDRVRKGQILARLDDRELVNGLAAAEGALAQLDARLLQASQERGRVERLFAAGAATQEELEQVKAANDALGAGRESATARLLEAQRKVKESRLVAPFDGIVNQVVMEPGEYASAGSSVLEISGENQLEVEVGVPESLIPKLRAGTDVVVELPMIDRRRLTGTLRSIGRATRAGRLFPVVVSLEEGAEAAAGMTAEVLLQADDGPMTTVPLRAVLNPGGSRPSVFRVRDQTAEQVEVEVDRLIGERVAVRSDLEPGDDVVTEGHFGLVNGDAVEVRR